MKGLINLVVMGMATWRLSRMFYDLYEDGPLDILHRIRIKAGVNDPYNIPTSAGRAMVCPYCVSWWVGAAFTILHLVSPKLAYIVALPFALSGVVVLFYEHIDPSLPPPDVYPPSRLLD